MYITTQGAGEWSVQSRMCFIVSSSPCNITVLFLSPLLWWIWTPGAVEPKQWEHMPFRNHSWLAQTFPEPRKCIVCRNCSKVSGFQSLSFPAPPQAAPNRSLHSSAFLYSVRLPVQSLPISCCINWDQHTPWQCIPLTRLEPGSYLTAQQTSGPFTSFLGERREGEQIHLMYFGIWRPSAPLIPVQIVLLLLKKRYWIKFYSAAASVCRHWGQSHCRGGTQKGAWVQH